FYPLVALNKNTIGGLYAAPTTITQAPPNPTDNTSTTHDWERILTQPAPPPPEPQPAHPTPERPVVADFESQLGQLRTERNRRQRLTISDAADEQHLRDQHARPTPAPYDEFDTTNEPYPAPESGPLIEP
ncbi:hypothetical protein, partial [Nocardia brasiliensis]|uniref:hypothetical protein n=1 Tax=Nocardia brasiliensis TaxID=37326 RepID=UPI0024562242